MSLLLLIKEYVKSEILQLRCASFVLTTSLHLYQYYRVRQPIPKLSTTQTLSQSKIEFKFWNYINSHQLNLVTDCKPFWNQFETAHGPIDDEISSTLYRILLERFDYKVVDSFQTYLAEKGTLPSVDIFTKWMQVTSRQRGMERPKRCYSKLKQYGLVPNTDLFNLFMQAALRNGDLEFAQSLMKDSKSTDFTPNWQTYECIIQLHCQMKDVDAAYQILGDLKKSYLTFAVDASVQSWVSIQIANCYALVASIGILSGKSLFWGSQLLHDLGSFIHMPESRQTFLSLYDPVSHFLQTSSDVTEDMKEAFYNLDGHTLKLDEQSILIRPTLRTPEVTAFRKRLSTPEAKKRSNKLVTPIGSSVWCSQLIQRKRDADEHWFLLDHNFRNTFQVAICCILRGISPKLTLIQSELIVAEPIPVNYLDEAYVCLSLDGDHLINPKYVAKLIAVIIPSVKHGQQIVVEYDNPKFLGVVKTMLNHVDSAHFDDIEITQMASEEDNPVFKYIPNNHRSKHYLLKVRRSWDNLKMRGQFRIDATNQYPAPPNLTRPKTHREKHNILQKKRNIKHTNLLMDHNHSNGESLQANNHEPEFRRPSLASPINSFVRKNDSTPNL